MCPLFPPQVRSTFPQSSVSKNGVMHPMHGFSDFLPENFNPKYIRVKYFFFIKAMSSCYLSFLFPLRNTIIRVNRLL